MSPRMLTVGFLSPLFAGLLAFAEMTPGYSPEADGRWWLSQSPAVRQQFVRGWTDGYINGWSATLPVRVTKGYQRAPVLGVGTKCPLAWVISYAERAPRADCQTTREAGGDPAQ